MREYHHIKVILEGRIASIILHRPDVRNAMHIEMIREIREVLDTFWNNDYIRIVLFKSSGIDFSSGADLQWMKEGINQSEEKLFTESLELAELFKAIHAHKKITISAVQGRSIGGANGIIAASDIVLASSSASFAFTEVKLGLIPATIAPWVVARVGNTTAAEWMLSGRNIDSQEAQIRGFVNLLADEKSFEEFTTNYIGKLLDNGPAAQKGIKDLLNSQHLSDPAESAKYTAELISKFRRSGEGQEGMNAFLEKRKPGWRHEEE